MIVFLLSEYDSLSRLGIPDCKNYIKKRFKDDQLVYLSTCCCGRAIQDQIESSVDEALSSGTWVDVMVSWGELWDMGRRYGEMGGELWDMGRRYGEMGGELWDMGRRYGEMGGELWDMGRRYGEMEGKLRDMGRRYGEMEGKLWDMGRRYGEMGASSGTWVDVMVRWGRALGHGSTLW